MSSRYSFFAIGICCCLLLASAWSGGLHAEEKFNFQSLNFDEVDPEALTRDQCSRGQRWTLPNCAGWRTDIIGNQKVVIVSNTCGWPIMIKVDLNRCVDRTSQIPQNGGNIDIPNCSIHAVRCCELMMARPAHCGRLVPGR